jgi:hypothetical protein
MMLARALLSADEVTEAVGCQITILTTTTETLRAVRWALAPTGMDKRIDEPERWVGPWSREHLVFLFAILCQVPLALLPCAEGLECFLSPSRPQATPAYDFGSGLVANVLETATLKEHR